MSEDPKKFSIIDEGFTVEGAVVGKGRLVIKGTVKGTLNGDNIVVAEEGVVLADARVGTMTVGGIYKGQVEVEKELVILATGQCSGKVTCRDLVVEAGGVLNADVTCVKDSAGSASREAKSGGQGEVVGGKAAGEAAGDNLGR